MCLFYTYIICYISLLQIIFLTMLPYNSIYERQLVCKIVKNILFSKPKLQNKIDIIPKL